MDQRHPLTQFAIGAIAAVFLIVVVGAIVPNNDPTYSYDVQFTTQAMSLNDVRSATAGTPSSVIVAFEDHPYTVDIRLVWSPPPANPETLTVTLFDSNGAEVASGSGTTSPIEFQAVIADAPTTLGPFMAISEEEAEADAQDYRPENAPATTGWSIEVERTAAADDSTFGRATSWTLSTDYQAIQGEAINIEKTASGTSTQTAVTITAAVVTVILLVWGIIVIAKVLHYPDSTAGRKGHIEDRNRSDRSKRKNK